MADKTTVKKPAEKPTSHNQTGQNRITDSKGNQRIAFEKQIVINQSAGPSGSPKKSK